MTRVTVTRTIHAPVDAVFRAISDIPDLPATNPDIVSVEFLGDTRAGPGTRFRETRRMGRKKSTTDLEITEFVDGDHVRMVADSHGTIWDTVFTVRPSGADTDLELTMDCRAHGFLPRILNPLMKGLFRKGLEKHVDAVKTYCED